MTQIKISWETGAIIADLRDSQTARKLLASLPLSKTVNVWGQEIYFKLPFSADAEPDASEVVEKGTVCYWLDGNSLALLFGPTPVSQGEECRLISPANIVGRMIGDLSELNSVKSGDRIRVESI